MSRVAPVFTFYCAFLEPCRPVLRNAGLPLRPSTSLRIRTIPTRLGPSASWGPTSSVRRLGKPIPGLPSARRWIGALPDAVAVKHYNWIKSELERRGIVATPYRIALAWNGGMNAVLSGNPPAAAADYAWRAANLVADLEKNTLADAR